MTYDSFILFALAILAISTLGFTVVFAIAWRYKLYDVMFVTGTTGLIGWVVLIGVWRTL